MNLWNGFAEGFSSALTPETMIAALVGVILGTMVGVLPGLGPVAAIAILLPITSQFSPLVSIVLLAGVYYGSQYGDSMAAILVNVPSEAPAIVIARDGYPLTKRGRGGAALATAGVGSFIGAVVGIIGIGLVAVPLSQVAIYFRPADYVAIALLGLLLLPMVTGQTAGKALLGVGIGLAVSTFGEDPLNGIPRFTGGSVLLDQGIELVPVAVGMFGMAELISQIIERRGWATPARVRFNELLPTKQEWKRALPAGARGSVLGFLIGGLPGPSLVMASFASHALERRLLNKEEREHIEDGHVQCVAGPKAADDGAVGGNLVPLLTLGIPFTGVTAVLLAGLTMQNLQPGPLFISTSPDIFWGLLASMLIGNVMLLILNVPFVGIWVHLLRVPAGVRTGVLAAFIVLGSYAVRTTILDVVMVFVFGFLGYALRRMRVDRSLVVLGVVLGPFLETALRQSLKLSGGNPLTLVDRPVGIGVVVVLLAVFVGLPIFRRHWNRRHPVVTTATSPTWVSDDRVLTK
jgi:putative tricarboxylic transport membrane protein